MYFLTNENPYGRSLSLRRDTYDSFNPIRSRGGFKSPPPNFFPYAFNFGATLLYVGNFSPKN